jgi:hypothetical protein
VGLRLTAQSVKGLRLPQRSAPESVTGHLTDANYTSLAAVIALRPTMQLPPSPRPLRVSLVHSSTK